MKFPFSPAACTTALFCLALAAPPPAPAGPLTSIRSSLKKLNPFRKSEAQPAPAPPPAARPKAKPTVAKTNKSLPVKKKKTTVSSSKKKGEATAAAATAGVAAKVAEDSKTNADGTATPAPAESLPSTDTPSIPAVDATPAVATEIPFGTPVMGRKGHVRSPYAEDQGMVDVTDIPAGAKVKCPFTGKVFRVP